VHRAPDPQQLPLRRPPTPRRDTTGRETTGNEAPANGPGSAFPAGAARGYALITVQDTGIGISEADLPHLYTSFYRGSNIKRTSAPGSGLGLTITQQILDHHGGTITIESARDHGTTATITLPLTSTSTSTRASTAGGAPTVSSAPPAALLDQPR
jgi:signal transduction histidine kinase